MAFVLDASATAAWILPDETDLLAEHIADLIVEERAFVPAVWPIEICNILIIAERRNRISAAQTSAIQMDLAALPILTEGEADELALMEIARRNNLTAYDASYIELAKRLNLPVATLDKAMIKAAGREQIDLVVAP